MTNSKQTEAMKLALEALEKCDSALSEELAAWDIDPPLHHVLEASNACGPAITALREALTSVPDWASEAKEQPAQQQEPVDSAQISKVWWDGEKLMAKPIPFVEFYKPAQRTWVGLSDEDIASLDLSAVTIKDAISDVRAIEAKLKEKNT